VVLLLLPMADSCWRPSVGATERQSLRFDAETVDEESDTPKSADPKKILRQVMLLHFRQRKKDRSRKKAMLRGVECGTRYPDTPTKKVLRTERSERVFLRRYIRAADRPPSSCRKRILLLSLANSDRRSAPRQREGLADVSSCSRLSHHRNQFEKAEQDTI
jgi:hypothetical protein